MGWLDRFWYLAVLAGVIGAQALVFLIFREDSYLTVQDNLDLFVAHFQVLKHWDGWFAQNSVMPMLGGIDRNGLGSEFSLYNLMFILLPPFWAYLAGYFWKILIGMCSFVLLIKDFYGQNFEKYRSIAWVCGLCYGILPLFPAYGIAFASIPLAVWILKRIYDTGEKKYFAALFVYPFLSYFSYFGFFLLAYLGCFFVYLLICRRKEWKRMFAALWVLGVGYVCFEYRLFMQMLLSDTVTIRSTMVEADLNFAGVLGQIWEAFLRPVFHASSVHVPVVLPLCAAFVCWRLIAAVREGKTVKVFKEGLFGVLLLIVFNCAVNGIYYWGTFRDLFEKLVPPLKGFQFNRTTFFNPFLWYAALFLVLKGMYDTGKLFWKRLANLSACICVAVILITPAVYNEFYGTVYHQAYQILKKTQVNTLNYGEYFSEELMQQIKDDIGYEGDYAAAYGLNPAILQYNGIATLDGYLGFYPQSYKEEFTKLIRPAYDRVEEWQIYYGEWGARAYLYPGSGESIYNPWRSETLTDKKLWIDGEQFAKMGGRYLFSRYELENMQELGFELQGVYTQKDSPYTIYLYEMKK